MKRPPVKKYQRLCAQYARAMRRAVRIEILLDELVESQLTEQERLNRDVFQCSDESGVCNTTMQAFFLPLSAEIDRWRDEEGGAQ